MTANDWLRENLSPSFLCRHSFAKSVSGIGVQILIGAGRGSTECRGYGHAVNRGIRRHSIGVNAFGRWSGRWAGVRLLTSAATDLRRVRQPGPPCRLWLAPSQQQQAHACGHSHHAATEDADHEVGQALEIRTMQGKPEAPFIGFPFGGMRSQPIHRPSPAPTTAALAVKNILPPRCQTPVRATRAGSLAGLSLVATH